MARAQASVAGPAGEIRPLDDKKAVELAANFIGEALIFGVAATGLILDSLRTNAKERAKERQISEHFDELQDQIKALTQEVHSLKGSDTKSVIQSEPVEIKEKPKSIWDRIFNRH